MASGWAILGGLAGAASIFAVGYLVAEHGDDAHLEASYERGFNAAVREYESQRSIEETLANLIGYIIEEQREAGAPGVKTDALGAAERSIEEGDIKGAQSHIEFAFETAPKLNCVEPGATYVFQAGDLFRVCGKRDYVDIEKVGHDLLILSINGYKRQLSHGQKLDGLGILHRCDYRFEQNDPETDREKAFVGISC